MGNIVPTTLVWMVTSYAAVTGLTTLARLVDVGQGHVLRLVSEHRLVACGRLGAAARNLDEAAAHLASTYPESAADLAITSDRLGRELGEAYGIDCQDRDDQFGLSVHLHLQHHPGQPPHWPNWIARLEHAASSRP